ncbi:Threonine aldolase [Podila epigama]|nr:Threonine aldolase [Podila epigama]
MPIEEMAKIRALANEHNVKLHLDGARLWHASIATGISMREYCSHFDTISLCLSKGIGAPIGSILVGSEQDIKKARHFRLLFGGGWRQAGFLAEAALWCIKTNWPTMEKTHRQAKWLEQALEHVGCHITNPVHTNMIWIDTSETGFTVEELTEELAREGIKITGAGTAARLVLHYQISDQVVATFISILRKMASTPRMKVLIDMTLVAMREELGDSLEEEAAAHQDPTSCSSSSSSQLELKKLKPVAPIQISTPPPKDVENSSDGRQGQVKVAFSPVKASFDEQELNEGKPEGKMRSLFSRKTNKTTNKGRPTSWYQPAEFLKSDPELSSSLGHRQDQSKGEGEGEGQGQGQDQGKGQADGGQVENEREPRVPDLRRTQSLDLCSTENRKTSFSSVELSGEDDGTRKMKKATTFQHRLTHNPASKAFRRASVRVHRWSTLLTREREG